MSEIEKESQGKSHAGGLWIGQFIFSATDHDDCNIIFSFDEMPSLGSMDKGRDKRRRSIVDYFQPSKENAVPEPNMLVEMHNAPVLAALPQKIGESDALEQRDSESGGHMPLQESVVLKRVTSPK
jgi:hypothetical protein